MRANYRNFFLFVLFGYSSMAPNILGQDWTKIVPLKTTCEDIKSILAVDKCEPPFSRYKFSDLSITVTVSDGKNERQPKKGTITRVDIVIQTLLPVASVFESLADFVASKSDVVGMTYYRNAEKGILITTQKPFENCDDEYVTGILLFPPEPKEDR